ncbi:hypothetical protein Tco_1068559 [Tanacetum coccineum]|uniref:Uncharacterized protein n=1 Tax=Tanacetum coccineum TaxID=301880 RepID=A0ABQ5HHZ0_9ASTR
MPTLAEFMIIAGADNHHPMLDKTMYDSWKSRKELYIENRENMRMILNSVENGPLIWPTVEENGETRKKKYEELSTSKKLQDDCLDVPVYNLGDHPIACLNKAMAFMSAVASSCFPSTNNQLRTSSNPNNQANIQDGRVTVDREGLLNDITVKVKDIWPSSALSLRGQRILHGTRKRSFQTDDLNAYDSDCDDISTAKAVLMANLSNYGSDVLFELIDSQIDDMIQDRHALNNNFKEKENKYMDKEIDLEKEIKELKNIVYKVGQSAQTVHMLTKPQVFYDDTNKQALGYQNPFYLKKAQRIKPTLYDGSVIFRKHDVIPVTDEEETSILEELNQLSEDFGKRFVLQQELSAEQAFLLQTLNPNNEQSDTSPVKIEAPSELPKIILVNTSLKKLKYHLAKFDIVVKKRITPDAITKGSWGV